MHLEKLILILRAIQGVDGQERVPWPRQLIQVLVAPSTLLEQRGWVRSPPSLVPNPCPATAAKRPRVHSLYMVRVNAFLLVQLSAFDGNRLLK